MIYSIIFEINYSSTSIVAFISIPWIVGYLVNFKNVGCSNTFPLLCRELSSWIYYSHMYFKFIWVYVMKNIDKGIDCFIFVTVVSVVFSLVIHFTRRII